MSKTQNPIRHFVHLKFPAATDPAGKAALYARLAALRGHLGGITDMQFRENLSPETAVTHGFTDVFWVDFADAGARDAYLVDPVHRSVGADLVAAVGGLDGLFVCDVLI